MDWADFYSFQGVAGSLALLAGGIGAGALMGRYAKNKSLRGAHQEIAALRNQVDAVDRRIEHAITGKIFDRPVAAPEKALSQNVHAGPKIITIWNLKGGVGKTTLAANLGAYFADQDGDHIAQRKRVLFIDLDFQGSLTTPLARTIGLDEPDNDVWAIFDPASSPEKALDLCKPVAHPRMQGCAFLSASFALSPAEERLKFLWAMGRVPEDMRFRMARFLQSSAVQERFDMVIIDCPPRDTLPTFTALCASGYALIPTRLDATSTKAISYLVEGLRQSKFLWPQLQMLGVVGTLTRQDTPANALENANASEAEADASALWRAPVPFFKHTMPNRVNIAQAAGAEFAYFDDASSGTTKSAHVLFKQIGDEMAQRLGYATGGSVKAA